MSAFGVWTCPTCNVTYEETDGHECVASDLAARVRELEAENAKLRRCVEAYGFALDELEALCDGELGTDWASDHQLRLIERARAARAEVNK